MVSRARKPVSKKPAPKTSAKLKKFATGKSQVMGSLSIDIRKPRVLIIEARFYEDIADALFERSEEHTSELPSLMRISYAVFRLKKKTQLIRHRTHTINT